VGSLERDKMVKALSSVIALVVFVVMLFLLQRFPDTIFHSFVSVESSAYFAL
jgi:flagellin-like protein